MTTQNAPSPKTMTTKQTLLAVVFAVVIGIAGFGYWRQQSMYDGTVTLDDRITVSVEVAANTRSRERGLSGREALASNEGMLFLFEDADTYSFWMKDMKFPIDIIWIQGDEVVDITIDAQPPAMPGEQPQSFFPRVAVDRVLEVPAGFAKAHGLRTGMEVAVKVDKRGEVR